MDELDDLKRLAALDRTYMLHRAEARVDWFLAAQSAVDEAIARLERLPAGAGRVVPTSNLPCIGLQLPPELTGIGALVACVAGTQGILVRNLPLLPGAGDWAGLDLILTAADSVDPAVSRCAGQIAAQGIEPPILAVEELCRAADHPVQSFLFLYGFVLRSGLRVEGSEKSRALLHADAVARFHGAVDCAVAVPTVRNPAKQLAARLLDRVPVFWGSTMGAGLAQDWAVRQLWYAERAAFALSAGELARTAVMARTPGYWPNTAAFVQVGLPAYVHPAVGDSSRDHSGDDAGQRAVALLARRRFFCTEWEVARTAENDAETGTGVGPDGDKSEGDKSDGQADQAVARAILGLEMGEWLALYSAFLYHVDPADRVPLELIWDL